MIRSLALLLALPVALAACSGRGTPAEQSHLAPPLANRAPAEAPAQAAGETPARRELVRGPSIYDLPVQLVTADGKRVGLDVARGKPVLVSMFYASCSIACPLLLSEVGQVLAELPPAVRDDVQVLMVSFDAARDTPQKLDELARERKLGAQWTLAAANDADARALAAVLSVKYRKLANGEFAHGSTIVALDGEGRPIARTDALGHRDPLVIALGSL